MAIEKSPYEGKLSRRLADSTCFAKIISVDTVNRTCRVKTMGQPGVSDDLDLHNVQWTSLAASSTGDGEEDTFIPRPKQIAIVSFIAGEPVIVGFVRPVKTPSDGKTAGDSGTTDSDKSLLPGDRIIKTVAGNQLILRSGGTVEIDTNQGPCRTHWIPTQSFISTHCNNHELFTAAGSASWRLDPNDSSTLLTQRIKDALSPTNVLDLQVGATETSGQFLTMKLGKVDPVAFEMIQPSLSLSVSNEGNVELTAGLASQVTIKIDSTTGNITLSTKGNITQTVDGNITQTVKGNVQETIEGTMTASVTGELTVKTEADAKVTASGNVEVKGSKINLNGSSSGVTTKNSHQGVIDLITGVPVTPSTTVYGDI